MKNECGRSGSKKKRKSRLRGFLFAVLSCSAAGSFANRGLSLSLGCGQENRPLYHHEVSVALRLIHVRVVGPDGKPARNLKKDDFIVTDDGKLRTITVLEEGFQEMALNTAKPDGAPPHRVEPSIREGKNKSASNARRIFLIIDVDTNDLQGFNKSLAAAERFFDTRPAVTDEMAVCSYSLSGGLLIHQGLTRDRAGCVAALRRVSRSTGKNIANLGSSSPDPFAAVNMKVPGLKSIPLEVVEARDQFSHDDMDRQARAAKFTEAMTKFATSLKLLPGLKSIILFSQGIPLMRAAGEGPDTSLEAMAREYGSANSPIYSVNSSSPEGFHARSRGGEASLRSMSELSGGKSYSEIGAINRFDKVAADLQSVMDGDYVIGFSAPGSGDGRFHRIQIEVRLRGHHVFCPQGYFDTFVRAAKPGDSNGLFDFPTE